MWNERGNVIQRLVCPRGGFAEKTTHWEVQGGSQVVQNSRTPLPPPLWLAKGGAVLSEPRGRGHPEKGTIGGP